MPYDDTPTRKNNWCAFDCFCFNCKKDTRNLHNILFKKLWTLSTRLQGLNYVVRTIFARLKNNKCDFYGIWACLALTFWSLFVTDPTLGYWIERKNCPFQLEFARPKNMTSNYLLDRKGPDKPSLLSGLIVSSIKKRYLYFTLFVK